jgi:aminoglycoside/choline kinase family phosphotransferase
MNDSPASLSTAVVWADTQRADAFNEWLARVTPVHGLLPSSLRPASSDASFRRYLRIEVADGSSRIVMDAPPEFEDVSAFIAVSQLMADAGLNAPRVLACDVAHGFLLLSDLGTRLYLGELQQAVADQDTQRADRLMRRAMSALVNWQKHVDASRLPPYDEALLQRELALFPQWCVQAEYGVSWGPSEQADWESVSAQLVRSALGQSTIAVHRDYMPRNLMVCGDLSASDILSPGMLDFQDAVRGPISYDVASMIRDAFISWDEEQELDWTIRYWQQARKAGLPVPDDFGDFWKPLEWMGLQRHLKVLGIFCRLKHRDRKPAYSADLPRFFAYAHKVAVRYEGLGPLARLIEPLMGARRVDAFY